MKTLFVLFVLIISNLALFSQGKDELISEGDRLTESFKNKEALDKYLEADKLSPKNWEICWRISRAYVNIGTHMPEKTDDDKDKQLPVFEQALKYADESVKQASNQSLPYLRRAIANGRIALYKGVFTVSGVVNSIKSDCERAIKLNTGGNYVQGLTHYVLGRTHAKISEKWAPARAVIGLGWADNEIAIQEFQKAIKLYPDFRMFYLDYAKSLIREDRYSESKDALKKCINSPKQEEDDDARLSEAKNLQNEIKNE